MKALEIFFFKYFSEATANTKDGWVRYAVWVFLVLLCVGGITCDVTYHDSLAKVFFYSFLALLSAFAILWIIVYFYHNWRIRRER